MPTFFSEALQINVINDIVNYKRTRQWYSISNAKCHVIPNSVRRQYLHPDVKHGKIVTAL